MKILFAGYFNPNFISLPDYIERAMTGLGHEVEIYDWRDWLIPGRIRARSGFLNSWDLRRINRGLITKVGKFNPDLLLVNGGWTIFPETVREIRQKYGVKTVNWIADYPLKFDRYMKAGPAYERFFVSGTDALEKYVSEGGTNGSWLPFACDPEIHRPVEVTDGEREKYGCDICFVGSNYPERVKLLEALSDHDLAIWGIGWERLSPASPLKKKIRGGAVDQSEWVKIFSAAKIVLNISYSGGVPVENNPFRMCNTRVFEILGCGAFQLMDARADAMELFRDREHLVFYSDIGRLKRLAEEYLADEDERRRIASAGRDEALRKHTYRLRIDEIIASVGLK